MKYGMIKYGNDYEMKYIFVKILPSTYVDTLEEGFVPSHLMRVEVMHDVRDGIVKKDKGEILSLHVYKILEFNDDEDAILWWKLQ